MRIKKVDLVCDPSLVNESGDAHSGPEPTLVVNEYGTTEYVKPEFSLYATEGKPYKVTITLEIQPGTWEKESLLLQFLRLQIVQCLDNKNSQDILNGKLPLNEESYSGVVSDYQIVSVDQRQDIDGNDIVNRFYTLEFLLSAKPDHLHYYASCFVDYDSLSTTLGLTLPNSSKESLTGQIAKKDVIHESQFLQTVNALFTQSDSLYDGAIHLDTNGNFRTGVLVNDSLMRDEISEMLTMWSQTSPILQVGIYYGQLLEVFTVGTNLLSEMKTLLESWTVRDTNLEAGQFYHDLKKIYDYYASASLTEKLLIQKEIANTGVVLDESQCRKYELICDLENVGNLNTNPQSISEYLAQAQEDLNLYFTNLLITLGSNTSSTTSAETMPDESGTGQGPAKLFFSLDFMGVLKNTIKNSCLLANTNDAILREILTFCKFKSLSIERTRIDGDFPKEVVVVGTSNDSGKVMGTTKSGPRVAAALKEVSISLSADGANYRNFSVSDNYISGQKNGRYMYSVTFELEDKTDDFIKARLSALSDAKVFLESYYATSLLSCSYDSTSGAFTDAFLQNQYRAYKGSVAPWIKVPSIFADALRSFYDMTDEEAYGLASEMYLKLDPQSSSPEMILSVLKEVEIIEAEISSKFDIKKLEGNPNRSSPKSKKSLSVFTFTHDFSDDVEILDLDSPSELPIGPSEILDESQADLFEQSIGASNTTQAAFGLGTGNQGLTGGQGAGGAAGLAFGSGIENVNVKG